MNESINQLINDEAVYRTAPATLGLLITLYTKNSSEIFTNSATLRRVGHRAAMSVCVCVCAIGCIFFRGLSLALRSHDQIPASHWRSKVEPKSGGQKWTPKVAVKSGPQKWRSKVDPKCGGQKRTPKVAVRSGAQKWGPKVDPKSGSQKRTPKVAAKSGP